MIDKPPKRHRPGGNLLVFNNNSEVKVKTLESQLKQNTPRKAAMCEEHGVLVDDMVLEDIKNEEDYRDWDDSIPINIVSKKPFVCYGHMEFPKSVKYITYTDGELPGDSPVRVRPRLIKSDHKNQVTASITERVVRQEIRKKSFKKFHNAAKHKKQFAFMRYSFGADEHWDREINITKSVSGKIREAVIDSLADPIVCKAKHDRFKDMIMKYVAVPDFDKRKKVTKYE